MNYNFDYYSRNYTKLRKEELKKLLVELNDLSKELMNCRDPVKYRKINERLNEVRMQIDALKDDLGQTEFKETLKKIGYTTLGGLTSLGLAVLANLIFDKIKKR